MGQKYASQSSSGYNSSPPADDGSTTAANKITWAGIKSKLTDVLKTFTEAVNSQLVTALDTSMSTTSVNYTTLAGDHLKPIEASGTITISLGDAATMAAGYQVTVRNKGTGLVTVKPVTAGDTFDGITSTNGGCAVLAPGQAKTFGVNQAANGYATLSEADAIDPSVCDFRLTLTSGLAVTTADVTAATTLYASPCKGNRIALFDGTGNWLKRTSAEFSIAVPATTSTMYDVFCYDNAGVPTLELTAWTNDTTRATALTLQNGVYVKTGFTTRRYLGSFRTTGSSGQTEDSFTKRYVWNYYNRVTRPMRVLEATDSWNYTTATIRQANGAAGNQLDFVVGVSESAVSAHVAAMAQNTNTPVEFDVMIGLDSTSAIASGCINSIGLSQVANVPLPLSASWTGFPGVGRHFLTWLEYSAATGTTTWLGDNGNPSRTQAGLHGWLVG